MNEFRNGLVKILDGFLFGTGLWLAAKFVEMTLRDLHIL